ncbi:aldehyde dehydrogenase, mitochondrial-like [Topomyia yanbarensis]|uniref:aldehyde dehydrogenase, mitochondrial-like n=1 Tax=Topomyia yanbarensis TaxID=2498891 RepID=UPI00273AA1D2|nr:aldehyde dehydrogenase, mitochondrial-like [Topomyia yanbarensis]
MANSNPEIKCTQIFINNEFVNAVSGKTFPTINPSTGKKIADIAEGDKADVDLAVKAAKAAFDRKSTWRQMDATARAKLLYKLAELMERDLHYLASLESLDNGKPYMNAVYDVYGSMNTLRYSAGWADKINGETIPSDGPHLTYTRKEPVGVVGQIIPWNYPMLMLAWKWGPALAMGCTIVMKPAEQTPLTALYLCSLAKEAGYPPGVINMVPGYGPTAGNAITVHPDIRKIAFTGSVEVGKIIMAGAAGTLKKVSLELGGKSPLVICDDVDVDEAAKIAYAGVFENMGQCCIAATRTFVQEGIYDAFVKKATELAQSRKVGCPFSQGTQHGPQVDETQFKKILGYIETGKKEGAKLETGGIQVGTEGYFIQPTVFSNVTDEMTIAKEEIFGPVQSIIKFKTLDEVIERANSTQFGLAAGIVTKNIDNALVFSNAVEAGSVWVNTYLAVATQAPFGGYKHSGIGREMGREGMELYLETKTVSIKLPSKV